jgi:Cu+-exporting ATPase
VVGRKGTRRADTIVLDKTGTVTTGQMTLTGVTAASGVNEADLLRYAAAVESASEHPVGAAITAGARARLAAIVDRQPHSAGATGPLSPLWPGVEDFAAKPGQGVADLDGGPAVRVRPAQPHDRGGRDGVQLGLRGDEQPAAAALPAGPPKLTTS